jgi:hypothetical protein
MNFVCECARTDSDIGNYWSPLLTITSVLKISTYIITSITAHPVRLAVILAIMSVSTFKTAAILYRFGM